LKITFFGATTSLFPFNSRMADYLNATKRPDIAKYAQRFAHNLRADEDADYDHVIDIVGLTLQTSPLLLISSPSRIYRNWSLISMGLSHQILQPQFPNSRMKS
jgi:hypothetical protein